MYDIIKNVINEGRYDLSSLLIKIDTLWLQSQITDEQKEELVNLARENADIEHSIEVIQKLKELDMKINELDKRVLALENGSVEPIPPQEEYPPYEIGKWYYKCDKVTFEDKHYECIAPDGVACTWSPSEYPNYWKLVE